MLDFAPVRSKQVTLLEFVKALSPAHLRCLTDEMVDTMRDAIEDCTDFDVTFVPEDPAAKDTGAATEAEVHLPWTLGHVIVHTTASAEESAFLAAELARGVPNHGRSRYEISWQTVTTIAQCRQRLEESRRMRLATLDVWPDEPHLDHTYTAWENGPVYNAVARFVAGLRHDDDHLGQIREIVRQAREARALDKLVIG